MSIIPLSPDFYFFLFFLFPPPPLLLIQLGGGGGGGFYSFATPEPCDRKPVTELFCCRPRIVSKTFLAILDEYFIQKLWKLHFFYCNYAASFSQMNRTQK